MQKRDDSVRARALSDLARVAEQEGERDQAQGLYNEALQQFTDDSLDPLLPDLLRRKGTLLDKQGDPEGAIRYYTKSLEKATLIGSEAAVAHALNCLGLNAQRRGDHEETELLYAQALEFAGRARDWRLVGLIEQNRGVLASMRGEFGQAAAFYSNSLGAFEAAGDAEPMSWVLNNLGILHTRIKNFHEARGHLERGRAIAAGRGDSVVENVTTLNLAEVWMALGRLDTAAKFCGIALEQAQRRGDHLSAAGALRIRAALERRRGALDKSIATLRMAIFEAEGSDDRLLHAEMLRELGELSSAVGNTGAARSVSREGVDSGQTIGASQMGRSSLKPSIPKCDL